MRLRTLSLSVVACIATCALAALAGCAPEASSHSSDTSVTTPRADQRGRFQAVIDEALEKSRVPGAAVIVDAGGEPWVSLTGVSDTTTGAPIASRDRFSYRGITTSMVVTVILQLAGADLLKLDDPVAKWVPAVPGGDRITLRELAGMRSGLPNYSATPAYRAAVKADPAHTFTDGELLGFAFAEESHFIPGARYEYSSTNTVVLGQVIQVITGTDWAAAVAERITGPLHLTSVSYPGAGRIPSPSASGYRIVDGVPTAVQNPVASRYGAAGGLAGSLTDLDRWGQALGSGELLTPELQKARTDAASATADDPGSPDYDSYGLGIGEIDGWWGHTGYGLGYSTLVMNDRARQRTIAILLNGSPKDRDLPAAMFRKLAAILDDTAR
ncbi:serine hydrolase domain-containing protein [Glaciibacter sp. 2TAF33]|uniref:serine hydrolase domain-containing protein n=1 Tax=Glaciibacter sp. 2TAF33 TaxID=3233015 RepID=UPI003F93A871